jgi:hypothetical protein
MTSNDVSYDFERLSNPKVYHFYYKPIQNDSYDISFPTIRKTSKRKIIVDKETALSPSGKKKVSEALKAYKKGEMKEFGNLDDLIEELNS